MITSKMKGSKERARKKAYRIIAELLLSQKECGAIDNEIDARFQSKAEQDAVRDEFMDLLDEMAAKADGP